MVAGSSADADPANDLLGRVFDVRRKIESSPDLWMDGGRVDWIEGRIHAGREVEEDMARMEAVVEKATAGFSKHSSDLTGDLDAVDRYSDSDARLEPGYLLLLDRIHRTVRDGSAADFVHVARRIAERYREIGQLSRASSAYALSVKFSESSKQIIDDTRYLSDLCAAAELEDDGRGRGAKRLISKFEEIDQRRPVVDDELLERIGMIYQKSKRFDRALGVFDRAMVRRTDQAAAQHPSLLPLLKKITHASAKSGQFSRAAQDIPILLSLQLSTLRPNHPDIGETLFEFGYALLQLKTSQDEVGLLYRQAINNTARMKGDGCPDLIPMYFNLAHFLHYEKHLPREALEWALLCDELIRTKGDSSVLQTSFKNLVVMGECYLNLNLPAQAIESLERAVPMTRALRGESAQDQIPILIQLGVLHHMTSNPNKAESTYMEALHLMEKILDPNDPLMLELLPRIVQLCKETGRPFEAGVYQSRIDAIKPTRAKSGR